MTHKMTAKKTADEVISAHIDTENESLIRLSRAIDADSLINNWDAHNEHHKQYMIALHVRQRLVDVRLDIRREARCDGVHTSAAGIFDCVPCAASLASMTA